MNVSMCTTGRQGDPRVVDPGGAQPLARDGVQGGRAVHDRFGGSSKRNLASVDALHDLVVAPSQTIKLAILHDCPLVSAGVAAMLADAPIEVVGAQTPPTDRDDVDIVLYDPCGPGWMPTTGSETRQVGPHAKRVLFSWDIQPEVARRAVRQGAAGCLAKSLPGPVMAAALERIMGGEIVVITEDDGQAGGGVDDRSMPADGLSPRETEVLALIARGLTNLEIAARLYVSINSVKAYIRSAYRKIGVERRTQAVLWGVRHGLSWDADLGRDDGLSA